MYYSYVEIEYIATGFSPARTDLAVNLLSFRFLLTWHALHDFVSDRIVVRILFQYIVAFIVSSS